jgi:hypothetical protein
MITVQVSADGRELAAITRRSVHRFSVPDLTPVSSKPHGAPDPSVGWWDPEGIAVFGSDGQLHRPGEKGHLEPLVCVTGFGKHRVAVHGEMIAIWDKGHRKRPFNARKRFVEVQIDRDGRLLCGLEDDGPIHILEARTGRHLVNAGAESINTSKMAVGGPIVAFMKQDGGLRWFDLKNNRVLELPWVQNFALSGSGTWIAAITPAGRVRIIDPQSGNDAVPSPDPLADVPVQIVSFVNRSPQLLVLDQQGVLGIYDLTDSVNNKTAATGSEILDFNVDIDQVWGLTGGHVAAIRIQDYDNGTASIVFVDLDKGQVISEVKELLPYVVVDLESGNLLQPERGNAIIELDSEGMENRIYRSLPGNEWFTIGTEGLENASPNALG